MYAMKLILANFNELWEKGLISMKNDFYDKIEDKEVVRTILTKFYNHHDNAFYSIE